MKTSSALAMTNAVVTAAVSLVAYYGLVHNHLYSLTAMALNRVVPGFPMFETLIFAIFFAIILACCALQNEKAFKSIHTLSLVLLLPSVLSFSNLDWLKLLDLQIGSDLVRTDLSFYQVLALTLTVIGGRVLFHFSSQTAKTRQELLHREASETDVESVTLKELTFSTVLTVSCTCLAFAVAMFPPLLGGALQRWLAFLVYPHIALGLVAATVLAASILAYLISHAKTEEARASF